MDHYKTINWIANTRWIQKARKKPTCISIYYQQFLKLRKFTHTLVQHINKYVL